jgi:predicted O-methyltransferase YrrM
VTDDLAYMITVSKAHVLPAMMLLRTLRHETTCPITVVGNLDDRDAAKMRALGATYVDENDVDLSGRFPEVDWTEKVRPVGWYRQMFLRLSMDRFIDARHVVVLDSEVFVFDNWDESRFYADGRLKSLHWVAEKRKSDWDYRMYRGAAYLLKDLPGCEGALEYANSDTFRRHISGVVLFSTANLAHLWRRLEAETDLPAVLDQLFNHEPELAFSDHDFYGIAVDLGVFDEVDRQAPVAELLGWYDRHEDPAFEQFAATAMWSMCQAYGEFATPRKYLTYTERIAARLGRSLPEIPYWNPGDRRLLLEVDETAGPTAYFGRYKRQLNHTTRARYPTMRRSLNLLAKATKRNATIVEIGTSRDDNVGGGHSTFKFGEYLSREGGVLHSVDILQEAIDHSIVAAADYLPWIEHHVSDSTVFLAGFNGTIDLLYLDGLDSTPGNEEIAATKQLEEIQAAFPRLAPRAVVLLDDAALPLEGKTRLSSVFLREHGFEMVEDRYQRLFVRRPPKPASPPPTLRSKVGRALDRTPTLKRIARRVVR